MRTNWFLFEIWVAISVAFIIGYTVGSDDLEKCPLSPKIRLLSPPNLKLGNIRNESEAVFIGQKANVTLECRSVKPIDFDFEGYLALELQQVETFRYPPNSDDDQECFVIRVNISTDREATGQYKCWHIGTTPPFLLLGDLGEEITVHAKNADLAILPCSVTNPKIPVALYRTTHEGFERMSEGEHLRYDPKNGFTMHLKRIPDPFGNYKCVAKNENSVQDEVVLKLEESAEPPVVEETKIKGKAALLPEMFENPFSRGRDRQSIMCTGSLGLEVKTSSNCRSVVECRMVDRCMNEVTTCPSHSTCKCSTLGQTCSKNLVKQFFAEVKRPLDEECETVGKNENGGVVACTSSKYVEPSRTTYFIALGGKLVQNWRISPREEILSMAATFGTHVIYNVGEKVPFTCVAARFVFSRGFVWKIQLKDGAMITANATRIGMRLTDSLIKEDVSIYISKPEIEKIFCEAPIWNETSWINTSLTINVRDTVAPTFLEPSNVTVYFHPNDKNKTLICEAKGFPHPDILWYRNGEEIRSDLMFDVTKNNLTIATLTFPEVGESDHGVIYSCNASNPRGMVYKTFTVYVRGTCIFTHFSQILWLLLLK
ncbi:Vascular endothelial growth factor receptor 1 [Folsomia candida]|uniref:Vascular endothelial growth factor receptor 1 n=1 Tax=Folsomia candida TaxID=158441 RepID=A0A226DAA9_FOLCA|nr:Vascular endothelial growth factor receptor 1 [Folsomia candida]